ncbi:MAG TPA: thiol-disulfide isomerase [Patescibacteria group bacterium]|nr:thiol-disulfide isomerase [Patescibacteria group bacterium]
MTFYKDVLPVLQKNCQECHRPGEVAPTSFLSYEEVRPQAKAMKEAVLGRRMPPWFADPAVGRFTNDRSLSRAETEIIANWVDSGTHAGELKDAPAPRQFADGWLAGQPDVVFEMPADYEVPASGMMRYVYGIIPTNFREDRWVQMAEARPGNRTVVHHILVYVRDPTSTWLREYPMGRVFMVRDHGKNSPIDEVLTGFVPGAQPLVLRPGQARLIKAGSDLVFEIHYTANGKSASDRSRVGIVFAKEPPRQRVVMLNVANYKFVIPPGAPAHRVDEAITLYGEAELVSLHAHMHLRGKSMEIRAVYPSGEVEKLLWVPNYDFNWQLWYHLPPGKALPRGTRIEVIGTFDNSSRNKNNPDPTVAVRSGEQSWDEMMMGFIEVAIDVGMNPTDLLRSSSSFHAGGQS